MIDEETIKRESEWVKTRLNCTADKVFDQLVTIIESDIRVFVKMNESDDCKVTRVDENNCTFRRGVRLATLTRYGNTFKSVTYHQEAKLPDSEIEITPKWDDKELCCDLILDDDKVSVHRASQKIIGNVPFPA